MSLWDTVRGLFYPSAPPATERVLTYNKIFGSGADIGLWTSLSASGEPVTAESIMRTAAGACARLLADDISTLPVDAFVKRDAESVPIDPPSWLKSPTGRRFDTFANLVSDSVMSLGQDGNTFLLALPSVTDVQYLEVLDPAATFIDQEASGRVFYTLPDGTRAYDDTVVHIPWVRRPGQLRGLSVIDASKESSGLELAAGQWAGAFFKNGGTLGGIVSVPGGPETVDADKLREQFSSRHSGKENYWKPSVLTGGAQYSSDTVVPKEAELEPLWRHTVEEAARLFHIPPHLLGSQTTGAQSYASVEQRSIEYVMHAVVPFTTRLERVLSLLIPGDDTFLRLNVNGLLRGDQKSRAEFYRTLAELKVMRPQTIAALEDLPPGEAAEGWYETPNNNGVPERGEPSTEPPARGLGLSLDARVDDAALTELQRDMVANMQRLADEARREADRARRERDAEAKRRETEVAELRAAVAELAQPEPAPIIDIVRDERGRAKEVYERRGTAVIHKVIEHDEDGRIIGVRVA